ncbi:hypothetical protein F5Y19DRAFT_472743 [Xylariaceae sp. FL1651]|nr:hypothetical protein F5Y19DRAFT_472743 [Xylariaceae sp. FL1651]
MLGFNPTKYHPTDDPEETKAFINDKGEDCPRCHTHKTSARRWRSLLPWALVLLTTMMYGYVLLFGKRRPGPFPTNLKDAHQAISYEQRVFTGRLAWDEEKQAIYRILPPDEPLYFGEPNDDIDAAWEDISRVKFLYMNEEELAEFMAPDLKQYKDSNYYFTPEMFHSLHCLNVIRIKLDVGYYDKHPQAHHHGNLSKILQQDNWERIHIDHCLDQIRQSVQCFGDLSPVPVYGWGGIPVGFGVGQEHTCRKWEPVKAWMYERNKLDKKLREEW